MSARAATAAEALAAKHLQQVRAELLDVRLHLRRRALADRDHRDDGCRRR